MEEANSELESFRRQWQAEVTARTTTSGNILPSSSSSSATGPARRPPAAPRIAGSKVGEDDGQWVQTYHDLDATTGSAEPQVGESASSSSREPQSALDHYEKAVERESQGSLGDSLGLYRKAFRMDYQVDQKYKNKHFPPSSFVPKRPNPDPSSLPPSILNPAHHSLDGPPVKTIKELLDSFSGLSIEPAPPAIEGTPPLPCPIATLPHEILAQILKDVAILDVGSFVNLSQVCKRMAYLVATEEQIWKRVCEGSEVGFGAMHYEFQQDFQWDPLEIEYPIVEDDREESPVELVATQPVRDTITEALLAAVYRSSWLQMFRSRPRIRFNGCYISTNNYIRPGQASTNQLTWSSPVHIVTYYRYLRMFRDGTLISLLTTDEPINVVRYITKENLAIHTKNANPHLPSAVMHHGLRGRWRLSPAYEHPDADLKEAEGDLCVETEGIKPKYMYRMDLSLRTSGKGTKNNKLAWRGFWSHNKLTDDWAEFSRRNEKPMYFSRVRSYGVGV